MKTIIFTLALASALSAQSMSQQVLIAAQTTGSTAGFTFRGKSINKTCASATTCAVTISPAILANSLLIVNAWMNNSVGLSSLSAGGTMTALPTVGGTGATIYHSWGYVKSASSTSGPITVTMNGTDGGGVIEIAEYTTGGGTPVRDAAYSVYKSATSPYAAASFTLTGISDVVRDSGNTDFALSTACAAPFNTAGDNNFDATNGPAFCDHVATTSGAAASITATGSGNVVVNHVAFGFGTTDCSYSGIDDHSGGTNASAVTASAEATSTFSTINAAGGTGEYAASASTTGMLWSNVHDIPSPNPSRVCGTGTTKGASTAFGVIYLDSNNPLQNLTYKIEPTGNGWQFPTFSVGIMYSTGTCSSACGNGSNWTPLRIEGFGGGDSGFHLNSMVATLESDSGSTSTGFTLSIATTYAISILYQAGGTHTLKIYDATESTLLGSTTRAATGGKGNPTDFQYGRLGEPGLTGGLEYFGVIKYCFDGADPCLP